ncbi:MAG: potassium transporter Kup [Hyphomicrobiaceae bacterium]|nr:potassium transporter Kup [Hyphomicrobiaceae bacterium]
MPHKKASTLALALGAIGVVYGDIGTSPIYALRETVRAAAGEMIPSEADVIGALSIIAWAITLIVTLKYAIFVLRADNNGEGGTLSIMTLARRVAGNWKPLVLGLGMVGASLFFGDSIITPAISVLSAVEGLDVAAPQIDHFIVPITMGILIGLFSIQQFGTGAVSRIFGPLTLIWFLTLGYIGIEHLADSWHIFRALNPLEGVHFISVHPDVALAVIGAAFLAVTGAEALYVDLGHFGRKPILYAWFFVVFPCLLLNYFGQGAYIIGSHRPVGLPLFEMVDERMALPLVILATIATVIASQAVISGAFSLTRQAIQLNLLPRMNVVHTSAAQSGQIFMPNVNILMLAGVLLLVLGFGSSDGIASAYGISITGEMLMTSFLLGVVMLRRWRWPQWVVGGLTAIFVIVDVMFLVSNLTKFFDGGWVSVMIASVMLLIIVTWTRGSRLLFEKSRKAEVPLETLTNSLERHMPHIVEGTAVFLTSDPQSAPTALLHSLKHYKVLHQQNVMLTVETAQRPRLGADERVIIESFSPHFSKVLLRYGYMEDPNVPRGLGECRKYGLKFDIMSTSFFLSRRTLVPSKNTGMPVWQDRLYIWLARNSADATSYFRLPTGRVVEIGTMVIL